MKLNIALLFGGKSVEHEISVISALQAYDRIDRQKYDVTPVYIAKDGRMFTGPSVGDIAAYKDIKTLLKKSTEVSLVRRGPDVVLSALPADSRALKKAPIVDLAFPIVHGTNVEDGNLQGYLHTLGLPYCGCDVLASAIGMDKHIMKLVFAEAGVPTLPCKCFLKNEFDMSAADVISSVEESFGYPVIVKPINLGSSVGITKAKDRAALNDALELAFTFSNKVLCERAISNLREINCAVLGDAEEAIASECEEPLNAGDILSYENKYMSRDSSKTGKVFGKKVLGGAKNTENTKSTGSAGMASLSRRIPADLSPETREKIRTYAVKAFQALGGCGVARIDFMIDGDSGQIYLNEINTIPGSLSFYLWQPVGMDYPELLDRIIALGLKRDREDSFVYSFDTNVLQGVSFGGCKK